VETVTCVVRHGFHDAPREIQKGCEDRAVSWWGWVLLSPVLVLIALAVLFAVVLIQSLVENSGERTGRWLATRPGMAERMARRPVGGRVGVVLVVAGLIPFLVLVMGLLTGEEIRADGARIEKWLTGAAALITSGLVILAIWWRLAADD